MNIIKCSDSKCCPPPEDNGMDLLPILKVIEEQIDRLKQDLTDHVDKEIARLNEGISKK